MAIKYPFGNDEATNTFNVGTASGTYATAAEYGDNVYHKTVLTLSGALPAIAGGANLAVGRLLYTFPAGDIRVHTAALKGVTIKQTQGNITADTPDLGLGTVIASGAVATLDGTATFENILTGQTMNDCNGTAENFGVGSTLYIKAADAHTIYLNVADGWAASGDAAAAIGGSVILTWEYLG